MAEYKARTDAADQASEEGFKRELHALAPEQLGAFNDAYVAMEANDYPKVSTLLKGVVAAAPTFAPALRRLCFAEIKIEQRNQGLARCRAAVELGKDPRSLSALATALVMTPEGHPESVLEGDAKEALSLAYQARALASADDDRTRTAFCLAAFAANDARASRECITSCEGKVPNEVLDELKLRTVFVLGGKGLFSNTSKEALDEASRMAREVAAAEPENPAPQIPLCLIASKQEDFGALSTCVALLEHKAPNDWRTHFFAVVLALHEGDFDRAERGIADAARLGAPAEMLDNMRVVVDGNRPGLLRRLAPRALGLWALLLSVILVAGTVLNRLTLRAIENAPTDVATAPSAGETRLRRAYAGVLWLSCLFYYLSIPLVLLSVIIVMGGVVYGMLYAGYIHFGLTLTMLVVGATTLWAVIRSLLVPTDAREPGPRLDLDRHPAFRDLLAEVASAVGTAKVRRVYVVPGTELAVYERGTLLDQLRGETERCLILGVAVLKGFELGAFRAVLAHELGHFSNRDTAGGGFALAVRRSFMTMGLGLARSGVATWYNPAWWFFRGFYALFMRISQGASRLQEVLADRWAVKLYGAEAFCSGLTHVIDASIRFDKHVQSSIRQALEEQIPVRNLYRFRPTNRPDPAEIDAEIEKEIRRDPSALDSHPSPAQRFTLARAIASATRLTHDDEKAPVWSLFTNRRALEQQMTEEMLGLVEQRAGVSFARPGETPATPDAEDAKDTEDTEGASNTVEGLDANGTTKGDAGEVQPSGTPSKDVVESSASDVPASDVPASDLPASVDAPDRDVEPPVSSPVHTPRRRDRDRDIDVMPEHLSITGLPDDVRYAVDDAIVPSTNGEISTTSMPPSRERSGKDEPASTRGIVRKI